MNAVIKAEKLGKKYIIGHQKQRGGATLRDTMTHTARDIWQRMRHPLSPNRESIDLEELWALKDINFEVQHGERIGIIGPNGAGKSTLLKILSRITEPTTGKVRIKGRVSSLLEVGTGFHPELTGRENIFLNGAILGMTRQEVKRKFDEIVAFAELEKFLDTPVKRYSSGMYVRLAFAVAAHLEPEILLVDEVLAVGDVAFQKKCLGKMEKVSKEGRTVLFVSHQMTSVTRLCQKAILIASGHVISQGPSQSIISRYLETGIGLSATKEWAEVESAPGNEIARLCAVRVRTQDGQTSECVDIRRTVGVEIEFEVIQNGKILVPNLHFFNEEGICAFVVVDIDPAWRGKPRPKGRFSVTAWIPGNFFSEGTMTVGTALTTFDPMTVHFYERDAVAFQIVDSHDGDSARGDYIGTMPGIVRPLVQWESKRIS